MVENPMTCRHSRSKSTIRIVRFVYTSVHTYGTNTAWLEFHVDMGRVCATVKDTEGELLVGLIKLVSVYGERTV